MNIRLISLTCLGVLAIFGVSLAEAAERWDQFEISHEIYQYQYKEPAVNVKTDGVMYGVVGAYAHHDPSHWMLKAAGHAAWGSLDYQSAASGSIDEVDDYTYEGGAAVGYDFQLNENQRVTPFFGIGYRYLNDDTSGRRSSLGARGYERESNYLYSPLGAEYSTELKEGWRLSVSAEYDILWAGKQESHLSDAIANLGDISNDQDSGYGVRGSVKLQMKTDRVDLAIEPFIRWWSIEDSQATNVIFSGVIVGYGYEPQNETLEIGGQISLIF